MDMVTFCVLLFASEILTENLGSGQNLGTRV